MEPDSSHWRNLFHMAQDYRDNSQTIYGELLQGGTRYTEPEFIARGGMKEVYSVKDNTTGRLVALTVLINEDKENARESFLREARITAFLQHPNIMPVYDLGIDDGGTPFFTMKLNQGESLLDILKKLSSGDPEYIHRYNLQTLMQIFRKICEAVAYAHSKGVIHLDIKPDNVQISDFGEVLLCDWGLGKITNRDIDAEESLMDMDALDSSEITNITRNDRIKGTPGYMAPEQIKVKYSVRDETTDVYALGALLYSLLTYEIPVEGRNTQDLLRRTVRGKIVAPRKRRSDASIPASLEAVCLKAMSRLQDNRYQLVDEMIDEVDSWQSGFATEAEEAGLFKQLILIYKRNKVFFLSLITFGFVFVGLMAGFILIQGNLLSQLEDKEKVAQDALKTLQDERSNKEQLILEKHITRLESAKSVNNASLILDIASTVLELDEKNRKALDSIAYYYFLEAEIDEFMRASKSAVDETVRDIRSKLLPAYQAKQANPDKELQHSVALLRVLRSKDYMTTSNKYASLLIDKFHSDEGKSLFVRELLVQANYVKHEDIEVIYKTKEEGAFVKIIGDRVTRIHILNVVDIYSLDLSKTGLKSLEGIGTMNIKALNLTGLDLYTFKSLKNLRLRELIVDNTNFKDLSILKSYDLRTLSIRNTAVKNFKSLQRFYALTTLKVDIDKVPLLPKKASRALEIDL